MDLKDSGIFRLMSDKMAWHNQRQEVLSKNISNADTPNFRPNDLVEFDFKKQLRETARMPLAASTSGHLQGTIVSKTGFKDGEERSPYETAPAGNAVVLEEQMLKVGQNSMEYQTVTNLYRKQVSMLKTAMTPPR
ncbi:flagellar basal body rod protein FlgB [Niveispirillum lacus]|uniref:Flagellar basal body rod protein FlgB n=1 Tax=Niveispirillum lacus TaxID=1981099 RepID=A0A255YX22_9PROT|nr:flagellar basal body rod protein FlgB [Niveispirillum lacus]OYQ32960.1 flagellar basal body rod protein FlgB [Niveispirillum lacus]